MIEKIQYNTYIIDFDRINELTTHPNDNPSNTLSIGTPYLYSHTRKILKEYIEIYMNHNTTVQWSDDRRYLQVCEILHYNRILVSQADIRDNKLNSILSSSNINDDDDFDDTLNPNAQ